MSALDADNDPHLDYRTVYLRYREILNAVVQVEADPPEIDRLLDAACAAWIAESRKIDARVLARTQRETAGLRGAW